MRRLALQARKRPHHFGAPAAAHAPRNGIRALVSNENSDKLAGMACALRLPEQSKHKKSKGERRCRTISVLIRAAAY
jgi:hypothetical protein